MTREKSWSVKGIDEEAKELARDAAHAAGMTIGAWIDRAIQKAVAEAQTESDAAKKPGMEPVAAVPHPGKRSLAPVP